MNISSSQSSYARMMGNSYEGIQRSLRQMDEASSRLSEGDVTPEAVASQIEAEVLFKANSIALRSANQLIGSLLDVKV